MLTPFSVTLVEAFAGMVCGSQDRSARPLNLVSRRERDADKESERKIESE